MLRTVVLALTVVTGFSGLAYEVTWQKYLGILLGAHSEATAAVLGLFLGGLSVGYGLFGLVTRRLVERGRRLGRNPPLLIVYGGVEAGIGLYCVLFPAFFPAVHALSVRLPAGAGGLPFLADVLLAAVLVLPPAILMGGTVPILTQALSRSLEDATRFHALVYSLNTVGAFAGALGAGFVLIPWLGLEGVMRAMGAVNLAAGSLFVLLGLRQHEIVPLGESPPRTAASSVYSVAALLVGFAMMSFQTILVRVGGLSFGSSEYTFSMVVAVFVLCIALGSLAVAALPRVGRALLPTTLWALVGLFAVLGVLLERAPYAAHVLRTLFRDTDEAFHPFYAVAFLCVLAFIGPAVVLSGSTLPLLFHALRREVGDLGSQAGRLYGINTLGSLLGALLGGYALLFWLDLHHVYWIAMAALALAAALVTGRTAPRLGPPGAAALFLLSIVAIVLLPAWRPALLQAGTFRLREPQPWTYEGTSGLPSWEYVFEFSDDDPTSSVSVVRVGEAEETGLSVQVNGKSDGHTLGDRDTMVLAGLVPALFAERAERAFVIGFGTGMTAGELALLEEMRKVTVAEISPAVIEAAPFFDFANHGVSRHPKVEMVRSDAYRALLKSDERFDVIVSEPSNPWVSGVEMLFSREFLAAARDRLTPHGVYAQWYHLYETDDEAVELVLRTYTDVFDHVAVWSINATDVVLLGFQSDAHALDLNRLARRGQRPDFRAGLARIGVRGLPTLLVHETLPLGVLHAAGLEGPLHALYRPRLAYQAGRAFFRGGAGGLPFTGYGEAARVGRRNSLLRRVLASYDGGVPEVVRQNMTQRACARDLLACPILLAGWSRAAPDSPVLRETLAGLESGRAGRWVPRIPQLKALLEPLEFSARIPFQDALAVDQQYRKLYMHAIPFAPAALVATWEACGPAAAPPEECQRGLRSARLLASGKPPLEESSLSRPSGS